MVIDDSAARWHRAVRADRRGLRGALGGGTDEQKTRLLPGLIDGSVTAAVGFGGDLTLSGGKVSGDAGVVLGAGLADLLLLTMPATTSCWWTAPPTGCRWSARKPGPHPAFRPGDAGRRGRRRQRADRGALGRGGLRGTLFAAEAAGGASDCQDTAVEYAKVREQFGRTIATFQAVKHHCANMAVAAESTVAAVWDAARAAGESAEDGQSQFELIAAAAATLAFPAYVRNAELNIQVHGGSVSPGSTTRICTCAARADRAGLLGGGGPPTEVFDRPPWGSAF